jgi:hypothetical protein
MLFLLISAAKLRLPLLLLLGCYDADHCATAALDCSFRQAVCLSVDCCC